MESTWPDASRTGIDAIKIMEKTKALFIR